MRPYFAIIKDSFRAAIASRVLYVLLILITLLLLALAPLHIRETLDWKLNRRVNVRDPDQLITQLIERREKSESVKRIWELLPNDLQSRLLAKEDKQEQAAPEPDVPGQPRFVRDLELQEDLIRELNSIMERRDFYREESWGRRGLTAEARELLTEDLTAMSEIRMKRLNRLLLVAALAPTLDAGNPTALEIYYAIWKFPFPIQTTQQQFAQLLITNLPWYFDKFVLSIGLLVAIVVTANMVPETFEPGSLNLLLSKPISRWGLFTAKFFGGCIFIGLCSVYLFLGIWLWLGLAMGVWDRAILFSIPLYIVVFAIYFAVSAVIGLIWRSPIVSVILTLLFWVACFTVGSVYGLFQTKMSNDEMLAILPMGEKLLASDLQHQLSVWNKEKSSWDQKQSATLGEQEKMIVSIQAYAGSLRDETELPGLKNFLRPAFDRQHNRVLASPLELQFSSAGGKSLYAADFDELNFKSIGVVPTDTLKLEETPQGIIAVTSGGGFFRLNQVKYDESFAKESPAAAEVAPTRPTRRRGFGFPTLPTNTTELFDAIGPTDPRDIGDKHHVDYSYSRDEFASYQYGKVRVYQKQGDAYELRLEKELTLGFASNMTAQLAFGTQQIVIAFGNGKVIALDAESLAPLNDFQLERRSGLREIASSPDGKFFGVLFRNGNLWISSDEGELGFSKGRYDGQGSISTFAFDERDRVWINYDTDRVAQYELDSKSRVARLVPTGNLFTRIYRLVIRPLYRVFPKPGEFYKIVPHLASSGDAASNQDVDLNKTKEGMDPWGPLRSGLAFMFGMLALGCTLFHFKDY